MRVLIVDDHPIIMAACQALFADEAGFIVTGAADAASGLASLIAIAGPPEVCVIDVNLPSVSGMELARQIFGRDAEARIVMFSIKDDPVFAATAIDIGVKGYVSKSGDPNNLVLAIREVRKGGTFRHCVPFKRQHWLIRRLQQTGLRKSAQENRRFFTSSPPAGAFPRSQN
ncbi:response regulator [Bradyrhizobium sp. cf659]|uniref:response regulator n=1 Tax=Bradyrhizobium sp. cf659 TaxID=1761771 RepID=UPI0008EDBF36|nr:response regulator transcription factor [Bradyrhizobium sp. cf659]SFI01230.1 Response regulator receiver domain-containing protein [Bradyrhizobium sp. cf659]